MKVFDGFLILFVAIGIFFTGAFIVFSITKYVEHKRAGVEKIEQERNGSFQFTKNQTMKEGTVITKSSSISKDGVEKSVKVELPNDKCFYFKIDEKQKGVKLIGCEIDEHTYEELSRFEMQISLEAMNVMGLAIGEHLFDGKPIISEENKVGDE